MRTIQIAALIALCALASGTAAQDHDLLFYVPFDGTSDAAVSRGRVANLAGDELKYADGIRGRAAVLAGDCRYETRGNFRPRAGTVAMWVNLERELGTGGARYLFCLYGSSALPEPWTVNRWSLYLAGADVHFVIYTQQEGETEAITASVADWKPGEWHHLAATWSSARPGAKAFGMQLYVDGAPRAEHSSRALDVGPGAKAFHIGRDSDASPDYPDARIDDVFVYGRALNPKEIAAGVRRARSDPYDVPARRSVGPAPPGWQDPARPYRVRLTVPAAPRERENLSSSTRFDVATDLAALGLAEGLDPNSPAAYEPGRGERLPLELSGSWLYVRLPGTTPAGHERIIDVYFDTIRYSVLQPLFAQRQRTPQERGQPAQALADYATATYGDAWDFEEGDLEAIDQWGNKPEYLKNRKVENGVLSMDVEEDPWFIWGNMWGQVDATQRPVSIDLNVYRVLDMRVRQSVPDATWELYGRRGTSDRLLHHEFRVRGTGWQRVIIDLRREARWSGTLSAFRIDPTRGVKAHVEIDWVRLLAVVPAPREAVEVLPRPSAPPATVRIALADKSPEAGQEQAVKIEVLDAAGEPVSGQPVKVELETKARGELGRATADGRAWPSLELSRTARRAITDARGQATVAYRAGRRPGEKADLLRASAELSRPGLQPAQVGITIRPGPPDQWLITAPTFYVRASDPALTLTARVTDHLGNPLPLAARSLTWSADPEATFVRADTKTGADGTATARVRLDAAKRWVYRVSVRDPQGLVGRSPPICLLAAAPTTPVTLGANGYFRTREGKAWLPLGGFYANWVGLPQGGEEGRKLVSFTDATEEQTTHWLKFLSSQGVTAMRAMLRTHRPGGMEPLDIGGRVNPELFAAWLRYFDLARPYGIRFLLVVHEDYTKPLYYNRGYLERFALPRWTDAMWATLQPFQARFLRDKRLLEGIEQKYTDPDAIACQDQYARELAGLLKNHPQVFAYELENEMVNCPAHWANHALATLRSVDPERPMCVSHGGGGLRTADPLWWKTNTTIDFYTYHLYPIGSTSPQCDYGAAVDVLTRYGRMVGPCFLGESSGDEFSLVGQPDQRRYIMRDIIWFSLINGNPGCFFWNARGFEVEQFRLAHELTRDLDWSTWRRARPPVGIVVAHPLDDDKYYRTEQGRRDLAMMARYAMQFLSQGVDFDFTLDGRGYRLTANLKSFQPPATQPLIRVPDGWQVAINARDGFAEGLCYLRNIAGIDEWTVRRRGKMYVRRREAAPLTVRLRLPIPKIAARIVDLDAGTSKQQQLAGDGTLDLGTTNHDFAIRWRAR